MKKVADTIRDHRWELSALMGYEAGKNRLECVGDVEESADLIEYYCDQVAGHHGFETRLGTLGPGEENTSVLRPYGVWAVISPFNFPLALAAGPAGGALVAGNTVVFKPASVTPLLGYKLAEMMIDAGVPPGVFNFVTGSGSTAGQELVENAGIDGIVFTGLERRRHAPHSRQRVPPGAAAAHHRDGREESGDHHAVRRPGKGDRRRHAVRVRRAGPEMLRVLARLCGQGRSRRVRPAAGRENEEDQDRQPARPRCVSWAR